MKDMTPMMRIWTLRGGFSGEGNDEGYEADDEDENPGPTSTYSPT